MARPARPERAAVRASLGVTPFRRQAEPVIALLPDGELRESQRDSATKPRVASQRATLGTPRQDHTTPTGLRPRLVIAATTPPGSRIVSRDLHLLPRRPIASLTAGLQDRISSGL